MTVRHAFAASGGSSAALWTLDEIARAVGGVRGAGEDLAVTGIAIDSREVVPGDLFVALAGMRTDGHAFLHDAFRCGARAALVAHPVPGFAEDDPRLVRVGDTLRALHDLAAAARRRSRARVVAVTGSAGKTSVKEALRRALAEQGPTHASMRSFNNVTGAPLSLARMAEGTRYGIFELGLSRPGELAPLARLVRPEVAVITSIGPAHLRHLGDLAGVARAKAEILAGVVPGGTLVLNHDTPHAEDLAGDADRRRLRVLAASLNDADAPLHARHVSARADGVVVEARILDEEIVFGLGFSGRHWVMNALLVLGAVAAVGGDVARAALRLEGMRPLPGRGARYRLRLERTEGEALLIDESYNANPLSLVAALEEARACAGTGRLVAVLSDMAELGPRSAELHLALADAFRRLKLDLAIVLGTRMAAALEAAGVPTIEAATVEDARERLAARLRPGDTVVVKGANRAGLGALVAGLKATARVPAMQASGEERRAPAAIERLARLTALG